MNKPVCLGLLILELSKILMHEFWYDYIKPKYGGKPNCVIYRQFTDSFIVYIKTEDIYKEIAEDLETKFGTLTLISLGFLKVVFPRRSI